MAKPIFIVEFPESAIMKEIHQQQEIITKKLSDYHCLFTQNIDSKIVKFRVFYEKDFDEIKFSELKDFLKDKQK